MDTEDINMAKNVFRLNNSGLGFSRNGYNGQYGTAITIDGHIVADYIDTGILTSILLKSSNYAANTSGMMINLADGSIDSKNFKVTSSGNATFNGSITGGTLNINNRFMVDASGNMTATNATLVNGTFSGSLSAATGSFSGAITGGTLNINNKFMVDASGNLTANNASLVNGTFSGDITGSDITTSRYTTLSAGRITLTGSGACLQINGSPVITADMNVITVSNRNSYTYPPSSHDHYALYDSGYQLNWAGNQCLFARYEEFISPTISLVQEQELKIKEQAEVLKQQESKLIDLEYRLSKLEVA